MGIEGVPKPESIKTKSAADSAVTKTSSDEAETANFKVGEKAGSAAHEEAEPLKTAVAGKPDHVEL
jgi:FK506-binding protein 2